MTTDVALVVIYNHRFDKNIAVIERLYGHRFSRIFHLVPFYDGDQENVIPVYENSYYFQGYIAQGFRFFKGPYKHYFFIADDMVLNPAITEHTYQETFSLTEECGFLPELDSMPEGRWPHDRAAVTFNPFKPGVEVKAELPSVDEARAMISSLGVVNGAYSWKKTYFWDGNYSFRNVMRQCIRYSYDRWVMGTKYDSSTYPFVRSYSDIFIIPATHAQRFCQLCGIFAATDLWVELAIPTAMALSGATIVTQAHMHLQGKPLWSDEDLALLEPFRYSLKDLLSNFPADCIYLHPVKLSKWQLEPEPAAPKNDPMPA